MRFFLPLSLSFLLACGGGENPATTAVNAAADAAGCKDLDGLATGMETWSATFETYDPMKPDEALLLQMTTQGQEVQRLSMAIATNPIVRTPACAPRWEDISKRMETVGKRMEEKMAKVSAGTDALTGCLEKCSTEQDPTKMATCMQGCQGMAPK